MTVPTLDPNSLEAHSVGSGLADVAQRRRAPGRSRRLLTSGGVPLRVAFVVSLLVTAFVVIPLTLLVRGDGPAGRTLLPAAPVVPALVGRSSAP